MKRRFSLKQSPAWLRRPLVRGLLAVGVLVLIWRWEFAPATAAAACAPASDGGPPRTVGRVLRDGVFWQLLEVSDPCHAPGTCAAVWTPLGWKVLENSQAQRICFDRLGP